MQIPRFFSGAASLLVVFANLGCSSSSEHASSPPDSDLVHLAVTSICAGIQTCCQSRGFSFSEANCNANMHVTLTPEKLCPAGYTLDLPAAQDCYTQLQANYASCGKTTPFADACNRMCQGTSANGEACTTGHDCIQPDVGVAMCNLTIGSSNGTCHSEERVALGDACNETCSDSNNDQMRTCTYTLATGTSAGTAGTRCFTNDGVYCAKDNTCQALLPLGAACANSRACQSGTHCGMTSSICEANVGVGVACSHSNECDDSSNCNGTSCVSKKATGQPCADDRECQGVCNETRSLCVDTNGGIAMTADFCANPAFN